MADTNDSAVAKAQNPLHVKANEVKARRAFVAWIDVLGAGSAMRVSHARAVNFVLRIHLACLEAHKSEPSVSLYPMNDGVFVICAKRDPLQRLLQRVFGLLATFFNGTKEPHHRFAVKGSIAYGAVSHGSAQLNGASDVVGANTAYVDRIAIGMPLVQAYEAEKAAPPFGVFVHESARNSGDAPIPYVLWPWWKQTDTDFELCVKLWKNLKAHYDWVRRHPLATQYPSDAAARHLQAAEEYFREFEQP